MPRDQGEITRLAASRTLGYRPDADALLPADREIVTRFSFHASVTSDAATYRVFDPHRPLATLVASAPVRPVAAASGLLGVALPAVVGDIVGEAARATAGLGGVLGDIGGVLGDIGGVLGAVAGEHELEVYEHHDPFLIPDWEYAQSEPKHMLRALERDKRVARGESPCPLLACGRCFTLADHPVDWVNREYVVTAVDHEGHSHSGPLGGPEGKPVYRNSFKCVPADVPFLPQRPRRRAIQTCLTATVIAPDAAELHTHAMAEIKVRFHWEREQFGTCWVRTMQSWAGAGWGAQFMPRVGMEVVVGFDGGDPDRPVVLGCLYNGTHPTPFALPGSQTQSGIRSHTIGGGGGHNELSFEDRLGEERVYLRAERDMNIEVLHDRSAIVQHDDFARVDGDQEWIVRGRQRTRIDNGQEVIARVGHSLEVEGAHRIITRGMRTDQVIGNASVEVEGPLTRRLGDGSGDVVFGDATRRVDGSSAELVRQARSVRVEGASELSSGGANQIASDSEVVLRCGESGIRVSAERIELYAPEIVLSGKDAALRLAAGDMSLVAKGRLQGVADKVLLKSHGAGLGLSSDASVDGARVLLNSPNRARDAVEPKTVTPTIIELKDRRGRPVPHRRYRVELSDGSALTGTLDENGRAEILTEVAGEVVFPDLAEVTPA